MDTIQISKALSYALRHHPETFSLQMDGQGFVFIDELLEKMELSITKAELQELVSKDEKGRYYIQDDKICALYGHSFKRKIIKPAICPPDFLYHGTAKRFLPSIFEKGLLPMDRQYVHLSEDIKTAVEVGKRRDGKPKILKIDSKKAYQDGIKFYRGNKHTWLSDPIPSLYLVKEEENDAI